MLSPESQARVTPSNGLNALFDAPARIGSPHPAERAGQRIQLPPLDAIKGFVATAQRMSITLAAEDLCLTQSAVSRQIQALEEFLRTPLLVRKHRSIALTDAGHALFELASPWFAELAEFTRSVRNERRIHPVTITASIGMAGLWILPRLSRFQQQYPNIDVRLAACDKLLDLQREGIDLAIRYCNPADAPPGAIKLFEEKLVMVAAPLVAEQAFRDKDALLEHVLLEFDDRSRPWLKWADRLKAMGLGSKKPKSMLHFNQYDQVIQAAVEGAGVALGRAELIQPMLQDRRLVSCGDYAFGASGYAYWLLDAVANPRIEVMLFRDWLLSEVGSR